MVKRKVLYVCHNHPDIRPGGAESYALELYEAMRESDEFEPIFLARAERPVSAAQWFHEGTLLSMANDDPNQYLLSTDVSGFDWLHGTSRDKSVYTKDFRQILLAHQPDVVHFQHSLFIGYDALREVRNTLPHAAIVYTLHEYLPICHRDGQMVRTANNELCDAASPRRCHECFPDITPQAFFMRKHFIQSHLSLVDLFLAPSHFLIKRYVDWGIPAGKIRYEENGRRASCPIAEPEIDRPRNRIGFFGQFSAFKGVDVLLKAMQILHEDGKRDKSATFSKRLSEVGSTSHIEQKIEASARDIHLWLHGANLEIQSTEFRKAFGTLLEATKQHVTLAGRYRHEELPKLMANIDWVVVPSIWWENAPLVIQEAFAHGRPVICSDIGGMAEKVAHGVNGLHFRARDPISLADTIRQAVGTPGLWHALRMGIPKVHAMGEHVAALTEIYCALISETRERGETHAGTRA